MDNISGSNERAELVNEAEKRQQVKLLKELVEKRRLIQELKRTIKEKNKLLEDKDVELYHLGKLNEALVAKEQRGNRALEDIQMALVRGLDWNRGHGFGVKRIGGIDESRVVAKFTAEGHSYEAALGKALALCAFWQEKLSNPKWHPFQIIEDDNGNYQEVLKDDQALKDLKGEHGEEVYNLVVTALEEINKYNPKGRYPIPELWNMTENRKASEKEIIDHLFRQLPRVIN